MNVLRVNRERLWDSLMQILHQAVPQTFSIYP